MKKFAIIAGAMAMAGALFLASPVSAQDNEAITAVLNDDGSATVSGTGWEGAPNLYVTICKGADPSAGPEGNYGITAANAVQVCADIMTDGFSTNPDRGDGGTTTYIISADKVGEVPEAGYVILQGEFAAGSDWSATTVLTAGGAEEEEAEDPEDPDEEAAEEEAPAEGAGGEEDPMTEESPMDEAEGTMAETGAESGLLAVIGVSVLLAGLFAVGIGRRFAKRS